MITKKHYIVFANLIGTSANFTEFEFKLLRYFAKDNPRFDGTRFLEAITATRATSQGKTKECVRVIQ